MGVGVGGCWWVEKWYMLLREGGVGIIYWIFVYERKEFEKLLKGFWRSIRILEINFYYKFFFEKGNMIEKFKIKGRGFFEISRNLRFRRVVCFYKWNYIKNRDY